MQTEYVIIPQSCGIILPHPNLTFFKSGQVTSPETGALFQRLILENKGCCSFELNGLFGELLRVPGYDVTDFFGRWHFDSDEAVPMGRRYTEICTGGMRSRNGSR